MKQGIHLGPPRRSRRGFPGFLVFLALLATLLHAVAYVRARIDLGSQREAIEGRRLLPSSAAAGGPGPRSLLNLSAAADLGAARSPQPTELLDELAARLPSSVTLSYVEISLGAAPRLVLEGIAREASSVSVLQRELGDSALVERTRILEERRSPSGELAIRVQLDLVRGGAR